MATRETGWLGGDFTLLIHRRGTVTAQQKTLLASNEEVLWRELKPAIVELGFNPDWDGARINAPRVETQVGLGGNDSLVLRVMIKHATLKADPSAVNFSGIEALVARHLSRCGIETAKTDVEVRCYNF
jgi:hypothetical protein